MKPTGGLVTKRRIEMTLKSVLAKEVYVRLSGDEEFICTTRYAGFRVWVRRVLCTQPSGIPSRSEQWEPGPCVRQTDRRIEAHGSFED
jgi:hypothetical protein